jgi:hypothetical protein
MTTNPGSRRFFGAALLAAGLAAWGVGGTIAQAAEAAHDHGHAPAAKPLPPGQRWATDETLRQGMTAIRAAFEPKLAAIHANRLGPADYQALADATGKEIANIVANCKLPPDAGAALHGIIAEMGEGMDAMAGKSAMKPREGAVKVVAALDRYGRSFDHRGWKRLHA